MKHLTQIYQENVQTNSTHTRIFYAATANELNSSGFNIKVFLS